jgi:hypothetical protein
MSLELRDAGRCESGWNPSADRLEEPMPVGWMDLLITEIGEGKGAGFVCLILDICTGEDYRDCRRYQSSKQGSSIHREVGRHANRANLVWQH